MAADKKVKRPAKKATHPGVKKKNEIKEAEMLARRGRALDLRIAGGSYRAIASQLGISPAMAMLDIKTALKEAHDVDTEKADELRALELQRLDLMSVHAMNIMQLKEQSYEIRLKAIDRLVKVTAERAKLLGLYKPFEMKHSHAMDFTEFMREATGVTPDDTDI